MHISEKLPSSIEVISEFASKLIEKIRHLNITEDEVFHIRLSLEEALINAIKHGNKRNPHLFVEVNVEIQDDHLTIEVRDQGKGFDFNHLPDPTMPDKLQKNSGRGVFLIKNLMDKVDFSEGGRSLKMTKFFKQGGKREN